MKLVVRILVGLVLLAVAAAALALIFIDPIIKGAVEKGATYAAGVETHLGSVSAGIFSGKLDLADLSIANPPGFRDEPFLKLGAAHAAWDNGTILSDRIEMAAFTLEGVEMNLERASGSTNYGTILDNLAKLSPKGEKPAEPSPSAAKKSVSIKHIEITRVKAGLYLSGVPMAAGSMEVNVPRIAIEDFHTDGTTTEIVAKLTRVLVQAILEAALKGGAGVFPKDVLNELDGNLKGLEKSLESQAHDVLKGLDPDLKGVGDALKGAGDLFKKK